MLRICLCLVCPCSCVRVLFLLRCANVLQVSLREFAMLRGPCNCLASGDASASFGNARNHTVRRRPMLLFCRFGRPNAVFCLFCFFFLAVCKKDDRTAMTFCGNGRVNQRCRRAVYKCRFGSVAQKRPTLIARCCCVSWEWHF